jgi:hypothetical protein
MSDMRFMTGRMANVLAVKSLMIWAIWMRIMQMGVMQMEL